MTEDQINVDVFLYYKEISKYKLLTKQEEIDLTIKAHNGDIESRNRLVTGNLRLVILIARKYIKRGVTFEDLIAAGNIGLFNAVRKFDVNAGFRFSTYATLWITQNILRTIESSGRIRIPSYMQFLRKRIERIKNIMAVNGEYNIPIKLIAGDAVGNRFKVTRKVINGIVSAYQINTVVSTDNIIHEPSEGNVTLTEINTNESIREVLKLTEKLPERTRNIIKMRFGIGCERAMTLKEISDAINPQLTKERIRQILSTTMSEMRKEMERIGIDSIDE